MQTIVHRGDQKNFAGERYSRGRRVKVCQSESSTAWLLPAICDLSPMFNRSWGVMTSRRIAEYFLVVGLPRGGNGGSLKRMSSVHSRSEKSFAETRFAPAIIQRFPANDYKEVGLPPGIEGFCFPRGVQLSVKAEFPMCHYFVSTVANGDRLYGIVLRFSDPLQRDMVDTIRSYYEKDTHEEEEQAPDVEENYATSPYSDPKMPALQMAVNSCRSLKSSLESSLESMFEPKCLCLVSSYGFMPQFLEVMKEIYRISLSPSDIPLERILSNFLLEVPVPPQGGTAVQYSIGHKTLVFKRPPLNNPIQIMTFPIRILFKTLKLSAIEVVLAALLTESQVLMVSSSLSKLTAVSEIFLQLMYPFRWSNVYIPLLPASLTRFIKAPLPFLIGTHPSFIPRLSRIARPGLTIVDLDDSKVYAPQPPPSLPARPLRKLRRALAPITRTWAPDRPDKLDRK
ncbi:hypothetical protein AAMO2058_001760100, partial [Amorphochlora amoebiformis]